MRQINYKLKKPLRVPPEEWIVVENTHEPIVTREVFDKVQMMIASRKNTRSRTHDFLLKGLIFCYECGYPLGVIQRTLAGDRQVLYFVCRTYQRFTKPSQCTCHCIRVDAVTEAVVEKVRSIYKLYLDPEKCEEAVKLKLKQVSRQRSPEQEARQLESKIANLTIHLDNTYADKLSGTLDDADFQRIYDKIKKERFTLHEKLKFLNEKRKEGVQPKNNTETLFNRFLNSVDSNRELLCSLISRIELTKDNEVKIYFKCKEFSNMSI